MTGIIHTKEYSAFIDSDIGVTSGGVTVKEINSANGQHYWISTAPIGSIFGSEVHVEFQGIGATREQALQRLAEDKKNLADSLWE